MELTISFSTILMAALGFLGVYILMPLALVIRDHLILIIIEKKIVNAKFWIMLEDCQRALAMLDTVYSTHWSYAKKEGGEICSINGISVSLGKFLKYQKQREESLKIYRQLNVKIQNRINWLVWAEKYFKVELKMADEIKKEMESSYNYEVDRIKRQKLDVITSDLNTPPTEQEA
ncbi:hypothetical protein AABV78_004479 [Enterobacter hormaechei]|uniref:hypothetical protein n=1 Tax=Enterobacter hormaechei TaxID=158836 RepID=UPI001865CAFC|nr:hypothetical protein [Enterobacter hormaechei]ELC6352051.1 hypothetical protein [Enterobacter hormaechei]ELC6355237.1 hypothetical protein [Enterobacter hormaechei]HCU0179707.1 hypothetical protein [Enterobacter hormaechei]